MSDLLISFQAFETMETSQELSSTSYVRREESWGAPQLSTLYYAGIP